MCLPCDDTGEFYSGSEVASERVLSMGTQVLQPLIKSEATSLEPQRWELALVLTKQWDQ